MKRRRGLGNAYRDDETCIGAMQAVVEDFYHHNNIGFALRPFRNAAEARNTDLNGIIQLLESDDQQRVTNIGGFDKWAAMKESLLAAHEKSLEEESDRWRGK
jgi:hypothetical protein